MTERFRNKWILTLGRFIGKMKQKRVRIGFAMILDDDDDMSIDNDDNRKQTHLYFLLIENKCILLYVKKILLSKYWMCFTIIRSLNAFPSVHWSYIRVYLNDRINCSLLWNIVRTKKKKKNKRSKEEIEFSWATLKYKKKAGSIDCITCVPNC